MRVDEESGPESRQTPVITSAGPRWFRRSVSLWAGFVIVHVVLIWVTFVARGWPLGDVSRVYLGWAEAAASGEFVVGITTEFVYPVLAFIPIIAALAFGADNYALTWLILVTLLNAGAFACLLGSWRKPSNVGAAWWWLGFLLLLGPIGLARIDSITVPLVVMALLWLRTQPLWATALLTVATWVKVWPAAILAALFLTTRDRWRVLAVMAGSSSLIVLVALLLGSGTNVFSFVSQQTDRGIQIESPIASWWMWQAAFRVPGSYVYYDREILTYQVTGAGVESVAAVMTPILAVAVVAVLLLGWLAQRRGARPEDLFPPLVLALVVCLIAFNKVGSPQFISWLAAPVILGLTLRWRGWSIPAFIVAVLAALTQLVYPYLYDYLLVADPLLVLVLTLRNLLEFILLGWAVVQIWKLRDPHRQFATLALPLKE
ncbi:glycosyltransferase 87 family protein [Leifsonia sp. A12D58]|uniref:glycosyltransferase 87 family protein n=1 Tax=Leifsonia sp. A12D58 TaxID=3397674 RepID=UPI0039E0FA3A